MLLTDCIASADCLCSRRRVGIRSQNPDDVLGDLVDTVTSYASTTVELGKEGYLRDNADAECWQLYLQCLSVLRGNGKVQQYWHCGGKEH